MYTRSLIDIIDEVVQSMAFPITIKGVLSSVPAPAIEHITGQPLTGNNITLSVNDIYHAQYGWPVTVGGNIYSIISWTDIPGKMTLTLNDPSGTNPITATSFSLYAPQFYYGTPYDTTQEINKANAGNAFDNYPFYWLQLNYTENFHDDPENQIERESTFKIYALTGDGAMVPLTQASLNEVYLKPMQKMMDNLIKRINGSWGGGNMQGIAVFDKYKLDYKYEPFLKFGVYVQGKGMSGNQMSGPMSGVGCYLTIKILRPPVGPLTE